MAKITLLGYFRKLLFSEHKKKYNYLYFFIIFQYKEIKTDGVVFLCFKMFIETTVTFYITYIDKNTCYY